MKTVLTSTVYEWKNLLIMQIRNYCTRTSNLDKTSKINVFITDCSNGCLQGTNHHINTYAQATYLVLQQKSDHIFLPSCSGKKR